MLHSTLGSQLSTYRPTTDYAARDAWDFLIRPQPTRPDIVRGLGLDLTSAAEGKYKNTTEALEEYRRDRYSLANPYVRLLKSIKDWNWSKNGSSGIGKANAFYEKLYNIYIDNVARNVEKLVIESIGMLPEKDRLKRALRDEKSRDLKLHIKYVFLPDGSIVEPPVGMLISDHDHPHRRWTLSLNDATVERVPEDYGDLDAKHAMHAHFVVKPFEGTNLEGMSIDPGALLVRSGPSRDATAGRGPVVLARDLAREVGAYVAAEFRKEMENNRAAGAREREIDEKAKARNAAFLEGGYPFGRTLDAALGHDSNGVRGNIFQEAMTLAKFGTGIAAGASEGPIKAIHSGLRFFY